MTRQDSLNWEDIKIFRDKWPGILMIKGINRPDDAVKAIEYGVDGIVVSNHGGRNMDSVVASIDVLPEIAEAVGDRLTVILDSGVRRGSDIAKALALGAKAVLTGRATLYGTAVGGDGRRVQGDQSDPERARQDDGLYRLSLGGRGEPRTSSSADGRATGCSSA